MRCITFLGEFLLAPAINSAMYMLCALLLARLTKKVNTMAKRNYKPAQAALETAPVETAPVETAPVTAAQATGQRMVNHAVARNVGKAGVAVASVIRLLVKGNPKRGKSAARFDLHFDGQTIDQYVE